MATINNENVYVVTTKDGKKKVELGEFELATKPVLNGILKAKTATGVVLYRINEVNIRETATVTLRTVAVELLVEEGATVIDAKPFEAEVTKIEPATKAEPAKAAA